jgi:hypothetical protein
MINDPGESYLHLKMLILKVNTLGYIKNRSARPRWLGRYWPSPPCVVLPARSCSVYVVKYAASLQELKLKTGSKEIVQILNNPYKFECPATMEDSETDVA